MEQEILLKALKRLASGKRKKPLEERLLARLVSAGFAEAPTGAAPRLTGEGRLVLRRGLAGKGLGASERRPVESATVVDETGDARIVQVNAAESPLGWLRRRRGRDGKPLVDAAEFAAGERLRADFTRSQMMPRVTANWSAAIAQGRRDGAGGISDLTDAALAARMRVEKALDAVGQELAGVLLDFCCFLKGIEEIERERLWPPRSAKLVLKIALGSLARHYGLSRTASGPGRSAGIRHWGTEDYRPTLD